MLTIAGNRNVNRFISFAAAVANNCDCRRRARARPQCRHGSGRLDWCGRRDEAAAGEPQKAQRIGVALVNQRHQVLAWNAMAAELWGLRAEEAQGENIFQLEIGLPLDKVKTGMRACLAGEKNPEGIVLKAVNRRGRKISCRVTCKAFAISAAERGVILLMEEMP